LAACHEGTGWANAITEEDGLVYATFGLKSVNSVSVEIVYDDLTRDSVTFERNAILMP